MGAAWWKPGAAIEQNYSSIGAALEQTRQRGGRASKGAAVGQYYEFSGATLKPKLGLKCPGMALGQHWGVANRTTGEASLLRTHTRTHTKRKLI